MTNKGIEDITRPTRREDIIRTEESARALAQRAPAHSPSTTGSYDRLSSTIVATNKSSRGFRHPMMELLHDIVSYRKRAGSVMQLPSEAERGRNEKGRILTVIETVPWAGSVRK